MIQLRPLTFIVYLTTTTELSDYEERMTDLVRLPTEEIPVYAVYRNPVAKDHVGTALTRSPHRLAD